MYKRLIIILLISLVALTDGACEEIVVIEGTTNVEDAYICSSFPDRNYGGNQNVSLSPDINRTFIRVKNVASELGPGATITDCVCSLYCHSNTIDGDVSAYRVFKPYNEGTWASDDPDDAAEGEGVVTWNDWSNDDEEWTTAGCNSADDGGSDNSGDGTGADRKATAEDVESITTINTWYGWHVSTALAQGWYDGTISEEGILLSGDGTNLLRSTEYTTDPSKCPFWTFTYTTPFPIIRNYTSNNSGADEADSVMLGKPTGVEVGDLLVLIAGCDNNDAISPFEGITGWTRFVNIGHAATDCKLACYQRIANGTEGDSVKVTIMSGETDEIWGWYIRVDNVDGTTPINDVGTYLLNASESVHDITQATSDVDNCLVIYALSFDGGDGYTFSESNTGWAEEDEQQAGDGGNDACGCWGVKSLASAGGAGTVTITSTVSDGAAAVQFVIAPAPAVAAGQMIMIQQ